MGESGEKEELGGMLDSNTRMVPLFVFSNRRLGYLLQSVASHNL